MIIYFLDDDVKAKKLKDTQNHNFFFSLTGAMTDH